MLVLNSIVLFAQVDKTSDLFKTLKVKDSLLFSVGFNTCDVSQFEKLISNDFEFYHDTSGLTDSKETFVTGVREGLCKMEYRASRKLEDSTLEVFPLKNNGVLYGAIQKGLHRFYAKEEDKEAYFTSIAFFTHVWLLEGDEWKLSRILSYDHQTVDRK
ncbi:hypothetical protein SCB49_10010 [unidentified eubacterium SCB49]|nr:hypothetical protein SCB49_10010 [unidentified eubacterium SCB49]